MPYCLQRLKDGRYIVLNRSYKPIGIQTSDWVDYDTHPTAATIKITKASARKLSWESKDALDVIFLYNDGCVPTKSAANMSAYLAKLAILSKLKVETSS
jgi:hypothetical protein